MSSLPCEMRYHSEHVHVSAVQNWTGDHSLKLKLASPPKSLPNQFLFSFSQKIRIENTPAAKTKEILLHYYCSGESEPQFRFLFLNFVLYSLNSLPLTPALRECNAPIIQVNAIIQNHYSLYYFTTQEAINKQRNKHTNKRTNKRTWT